MIGELLAHVRRGEDLLRRGTPPVGRQGGDTPDLIMFPQTTEGRDVMSRIVYGARVSLQVGIIAVAATVILVCTDQRDGRRTSRRSS